MIRADQIPDEVFYAFQKAWANRDTLSTKECLAAALNARPGAQESGMTMGPYKSHIYILPLPQEPRDE